MPATAYELKMDRFTGPLEKLLALVEERELPINDISLAAVTGDFLDYLKKLEGGVETVFLSDFLVIAAKLVLIKSKTLLPSIELTAEEEGEIKDLESRLAIYREFKAAGALLKNNWHPLPAMYRRPLLTSFREGMLFYPPEGVTAVTLLISLLAAVKRFEEIIPEKATVKKILVTVEEKVQELLSRFAERIAHSFASVAKDKSRDEVIALFLAILHLLKEKKIEVEQGEHFSDILVKKNAT